MKWAAAAATLVVVIPLLVIMLIVGAGDECAIPAGDDAGSGSPSTKTVDPEDITVDTVGSWKKDPQLMNAAFIMNAAKDLDLPLRAQIIGVMTAMGESSLTVLDRGDSVGPDSRGLFQQRDNGAWGSYEDRMDPYISATNFFTALKDVDDWQNLEPTIAAHRVQRNADPNHYATHWNDASDVVEALGDITIQDADAGSHSNTSSETCTADPGGGALPPPGIREPGPWGGHDNGQIPDDQMMPIPWAKGQMLREDATQALILLNNAFKEEFGTDMYITDSYRSYADQVRLKRQKGRMAATPGTSKHGWALAVDLGSGINRFGTRQYQWMLLNAPKYGWINPEWAQQTGNLPEAWHWEFWGVE